MRANITEPRQASIPSNVEPEAKPVIVVVSRGGEATRQKRRLRLRKVRRDLLGRLQKSENEEQMLDIQKREGSGDSKSQTPIEAKAVAIETIERTADDLLSDHKTGQPGSGCDR
jgi:hypothetical protein